MTDPSGTTTYLYNAGEQSTSVTKGATTSYTWDNNGNLTDRGTDSFAWDYENRMTSATVAGVTTTFAYRADGLRNSRTVGGVTTTFTWDVGRDIPVVLDDGATKFVYGPTGLLSQHSVSGARYYLADGLGSTVKLVDQLGNVANAYTYDVYGKVTAQSGSQANDFQFAGEQTDSSTGLQYLRNRYYDPGTGRFISRDPLEGVPGWSQNPFSYAAGNPLAASDPLGLEVVWSDTHNTWLDDGNGALWDPTTEWWVDPDTGYVWTVDGWRDIGYGTAPETAADAGSGTTPAVEVPLPAPVLVDLPPSAQGTPTISDIYLPPAAGTPAVPLATPLAVQLPVPIGYGPGPSFVDAVILVANIYLTIFLPTHDSLPFPPDPRHLEDLFCDLVDCAN